MLCNGFGAYPTIGLVAAGVLVDNSDAIKQVS